MAGAPGARAALLAGACVAWCLPGLFVEAAAPRHEVPDHAGPTHLHELDYVDGVLSMTKFRDDVSEEHISLLQEGMETGVPLFKVTFNFDIETMDAGSGLTMTWDKQEHSLSINPGKLDAEGICWGKYKDTISKNGWSNLYLTFSKSYDFSNDVKFYSIGWIEGILTAVRMSQFYANSHKALLKAEANWGSLSNIKTELTGAVKFMKKKAGLGNPRTMAEEPGSPYWRLARYMIFQLWGMQEGYNYVAKHFNVHKLGMIDYTIINEQAEMPTLFQAFVPEQIQDRDEYFNAFLQLGSRRVRQHANRLKRLRGTQREEGLNIFKESLRKRTRSAVAKTWDRLAMVGANVSSPHDTALSQLDDQHWETRMALDGRCSAFVRVTAGNGDLLCGHTTWGDYTSMLRIFKYYDFWIYGAPTMAKNIGFSSYPGCISSTDEWYIMDSGLLVMDTSIEVIDDDIYVDVVDFTVYDVKTLPNFMHLQIVNRLAKTPEHWVELFSAKNSGTMNCQWMIVDYNNFRPGKPVMDNVFWVLETIPGKMHSADMSHRLRTHGYWGSYNRPYFQDIREKTGHDGAQKSLGAFYSWADNPRAIIMAGSAGGINAISDLRKLMNRNQYPNAGISPDTPGHEISARFDLSSSTPFPNGGIDAKVTCRKLFKQLKCQGESGPAHGDVRAFTWTKADGRPWWPGYSHIGQPDTWDFDYIELGPSGTGSAGDC